MRTPPSFLPDKLDAPFYTDEELDALEAVDPVAATRIAREQIQLRRRNVQTGADSREPTLDELTALLSEVRAILGRDGGDVELLSYEARVVTVKLKGNCAGCPRAPLDLKHVVEAKLRERFPVIAGVRSGF
jgi:Fe-S cluster biogenesis protein NfuA